MYKIAVLSSTSGTNLQSIIDAIKAGNLKDVEIVCLITNDIEAHCINKAEKAGIKPYCIFKENRTREEYDAEIDKVLNYFDGVDLIVLGGWMRILSKEFVEKYKHKIINIHPSLLPKYPGMDMDVHQAVIDGGETESGMTIHFVDEGMDTGPIILQKKVEVGKYDTAKKLKAKVQELEKEWYPKVIGWFANDEVKIDGDKVTVPNG